jgi:adenosine deaminase
MSTSRKPDLAFTKALPKVELHAHLTGSISRKCLHDIWLQKESQDPTFELEDPLTAIPHAVDGGIDVVR